jgi:hypothetical protein
MRNTNLDLPKGQQTLIKIKHRSTPGHIIVELLKDKGREGCMEEGWRKRDWI